jgi:hypothetical protein
MSPSELIAALKRIHNLSISTTTLYRYKQQGLITEPQSGGLGQGRGKFADYPPISLAETYAAYSLLSGKYESLIKSLFQTIPGIPPEYIAAARKKYRDSEPFSYQTTLESLGTAAKSHYEQFVFETWKYHYEYAQQIVEDKLLKARIDQIEAKPNSTIPWD